MTKRPSVERMGNLKYKFYMQGDPKYYHNNFENNFSIP
jgi:hypothetical protein